MPQLLLSPFLRVQVQNIGMRAPHSFFCSLSNSRIPPSFSRLNAHLTMFSWVSPHSQFALNLPNSWCPCHDAATPDSWAELDALAAGLAQELGLVACGDPRTKAPWLDFPAGASLYEGKQSTLRRWMINKLVVFGPAVDRVDGSAP